MRFSFKYIFALFALIFSCFSSSHAQQFQWVKGGGTNQTSSYLNNNPEGVYYMCTDSNSNVYTLSIVGNTAIHADTFYRSGAYGVDLNLLVSSYDCSGQMRWAKLIGSSAGLSYPLGIVVDNFGHVYMSCASPNGTLHIGNDTSITGSLNKVLNLIMFDTLGHFNWIYQVGNNTPANRAATYTSTASLALDNTNNVHLIPYIGVGSLLTPTLISHFGNYDLKFNSSGVLLSAKRLQQDSSLVVTNATIDHRSNIIYGHGYRSYAFPDSSAYNFLAAFDTNGNRIWVDTLGNFYASTNNITGIAADNSGHLYVTANGFGYMLYKGDTIYPNYGSYISFLMKTDTAGNRQWWKQCNGNGAIGSPTILPGNKVATTGHFYVKEKCGTDSITNSSAGADPFIYMVDTSGSLLMLKGIHGDGYSDNGISMACDRQGNLYIGGMVADSIPDAVIPAYHSVGGNTDFFVLKYGLPCNCTSTPTASFTYSGSNPVTFTYSGTTTGLDSVAWHFGDGYTGTGLSISHGYTISDTFHVCEYTYSQCGVDSSCTDIVVIGVGINEPGYEFGNISIYPNPVTDELVINGLKNQTIYRVLSVTGEAILSGAFNKGDNSISLNKLSSGLYILEVTGSEGQKTNFRLIKN
ncbi:hypothetical protein CJD36_017700 [Flavipsychrobacter stenotrophus]|uniref:PKD domain-containing protein n=1 Tax=Flavipsychrobacter stenotrophus TaxID=2077091 RepID=A0A2S7SS62_9BACT|nr:T9SS type A sorting domain-containing protein [Flavipsychrobacter stenotrophus]PQJ09762.1 hypothetical protein CJD36_017700 [Flavipsychrobacter stenotrophus]